MGVYKLNVSSNNFKSSYVIFAKNIKEATIKAKAQFARQFREFNVKVGLDPTDLSNHIDEIMEKFVEE